MHDYLQSPTLALIRLLQRDLDLLVKARAHAVRLKKNYYLRNKPNNLLYNSNSLNHLLNICQLCKLLSIYIIMENHKTSMNAENTRKSSALYTAQDVYLDTKSSTLPEKTSQKSFGTPCCSNHVVNSTTVICSKFAISKREDSKSWDRGSTFRSS